MPASLLTLLCIFVYLSLLAALCRRHYCPEASTEIEPCPAGTYSPYNRTEVSQACCEPGVCVCVVFILKTVPISALGYRGSPVIIATWLLHECT